MSIPIEASSSSLSMVHIYVNCNWGESSPSLVQRDHFNKNTNRKKEKEKRKNDVYKRRCVYFDVIAFDPPPHSGAHSIHFLGSLQRARAQSSVWRWCARARVCVCVCKVKFSQFIFGAHSNRFLMLFIAFIALLAASCPITRSHRIEEIWRISIYRVRALRSFEQMFLLFFFLFFNLWLSFLTGHGKTCCSFELQIEISFNTGGYVSKCHRKQKRKTVSSDPVQVAHMLWWVRAHYYCLRTAMGNYACEICVKSRTMQTTVKQTAGKWTQSEMENRCRFVSSPQ